MVLIQLLSLTSYSRGSGLSGTVNEIKELEQNNIK